MNLSESEKEDIREIYEIGYFMDNVFSTKQDASGNNLSEEDILFLIDGASNLDLFSNYEYSSGYCELCGSHGEIKVTINNKEITIKEW